VKKLLFILVILTINAATNAALKIMVNGVVDPPDTQICSMPGDYLVIGLWSDGGWPQPNFTAMLFAAGDGTISGGKMYYAGSLDGIYDITGPDLQNTISILESQGYHDITSVIAAEFVDAAPQPLPLQAGQVVDWVYFQCTDLWPATIWLLNSTTFEVYDSQLVHQSAIPEPVTVILFCLGGLFLRSRSRS